MSEILVSKKMGVRGAANFVFDVSNDAYFAYAGRHIPYANSGDSTIATPTDDVKYNVYDAYSNMIFGKRVLSTDVTQMIIRNDWSSGSRYDMYDDEDNQLYDKPFYATVNAGASYHVYKCLYNGGNVVSTVEPSGTDSAAFETPGDGYIWKYMFTANSSQMNKFATSTYMPVIANTSVQQAATPGSIEVIKIESGGLGYDNYMSGSIESANDLKVGGDPTLFAIGANGSSANNFYNGCLMLVTSGAAQNEYKVIENYYVSGAQKIVQLDSEFTADIGVNDTFEIYPFVYLFDTGGQKTSNCIARAIVSNSSGNSISSIEVLTPGGGYRSARAILDVANNVPVTANAVLRPVISPPGGHGSNPYTELAAAYAGISVQFVQDEEALSPDNDFRQIGLIKNPLFANVAVNINGSNTVGVFASGELVYEYSDVLMTGTVSCNTTSTEIEGTGTDFEKGLQVGSTVLLTDGESNHLATIAAVTNSTSATMSSNSSFANTDCSLSVITPATYGYVTGSSSGLLFLSNVAVGDLTFTNKLIGSGSFATTTVNTAAAIPVSINGRSVNNYNTFTQLTKFIGTLDSGAFEEDETITQGSNAYTQPSARLHSFVENGADDELYVTNVLNTFETSNTIVGANSGAVFTINSKYQGDLVPDTGEIVYMENNNPISRSDAQTETAKIILEF